MEGIGNRSLVTFRVGKYGKNGIGGNGTMERRGKMKGEREEEPWHQHNKFATLRAMALMLSSGMV